MHCNGVGALECDMSVLGLGFFYQLLSCAVKMERFLENVGGGHYSGICGGTGLARVGHCHVHVDTMFQLTFSSLPAVFATVSCCARRLGQEFCWSNESNAAVFISSQKLT